MLTIVPPVIQRAVLPRETEIVTFVLTGADGILTARLVPPVDGIRLKRLQTQRVIQRPFDPETDGPLPPGMQPPPGIEEREVVEAVEPGEPIAVGGLELLGEIEFGTHAPAEWMVSTTLLFSVAGIVILAVPVTLFNGEPRVDFPGQPLEAQIGRTTRVLARVSLPTGAPAVAVTLSSTDGHVTIPPRMVAVAGGQSTETELDLHLSIGTQPSVFQAHVFIDGFGGEQLRFPFAIRAVLPPPPPDPIAPQANIDAIDRYWRERGAGTGPLGWPLANVERVRETFLRRFAGGTVRSARGVASLADRQHVHVQFLGFQCLGMSSPLGNDEPYFIVGAAGSNGTVTRLFGPFDVGFVGHRQMISFELAGRDLALVPPVTLVVYGFEHDHGTPREAEAQARVVIARIPLKLADAVDPASATIDSHVIGKWFRAAGIGLIFEGLAGLLGMGDDHIGRSVTLLHEDIPDLLARKQYPVIGHVGQAPYTHIVGLHGQEGNYMLFFRIHLDVNTSPAPLPPQ